MKKKNENILMHLQKYEARHNIGYTSPDSISASSFRKIHYIAVIYAALMNIMALAGFCLKLGQAINADSGLDYSNLLNVTVTVGLFTVLLVACLFVLRTKNPITAACYGAVNLVSSVTLFITLALQLNDSDAALGVKSKFIYLHGIPLVIAAVSGTVLAIITVRYYILQTNAYEKFESDLYRAYSGNFDSLSDEQWQDFLDNYEPIRPEKLKRSRKAKIKKEAENHIE